MNLNKTRRVENDEFVDFESKRIKLSEGASESHIVYNCVYCNFKCFPQSAAKKHLETEHPFRPQKLNCEATTAAGNHFDHLGSTSTNTHDNSNRLEVKVQISSSTQGQFQAF